jgi:AcrR family transcriptional regulator
MVLPIFHCGHWQRPLIPAPECSCIFFGSKERLIAQTLAHIRTREQLDFRRAVSRSSSANREGLLLREWKSWSSPRREKYLRLFFEVYGLALQNRERFPGFLEDAVGEWLPLVERAFAVAVAREHAQALATLALAAVRGLGSARHRPTITH